MSMWKNITEKRIQTIALVVPVVLLVVGYLIYYPNVFGFCLIGAPDTHGYIYGCYYPRGVDFHSLLLIHLSWGLLPVSLSLLFMKKEIFITWFKFSVWAFPLFIFLSISMGGVNRGFFVPNEDEWATIFSWLFVVISLAIIGWKYWRLSKQPKK